MNDKAYTTFAGANVRASAPESSPLWPSIRCLADAQLDVLRIKRRLEEAETYEAGLRKALIARAKAEGATVDEVGTGLVIHQPRT